MNDLESNLRASLKTISVPHDDTRADEMIAAATAGSPMADRRNVIAPLAAAAAVVAVGATVAVLASGSPDDPDEPAGLTAPARTSATAVPVMVTYLVNAPVSRAEFVAGTQTVRYGFPPGQGSETPIDLGVLSSISSISIGNPYRDDATVRVQAGRGRTVLTRDVAGRSQLTTAVRVADTTDVKPLVQCRKPGSGDTCRLQVVVTGTQELVTDTATSPVTSSGPSDSGAATPPAACSGCEIP